jgi:hypothetical protein
MSHKLPLAPHHPADIAAALFEDLLAELAEARERIAHLTAANGELSEWVADLEAEVLAVRARGPFLPVTLGHT